MNYFKIRTLISIQTILLFLLITIIPVTPSYSQEASTRDIKIPINYAYSNQMELGGYNIAGLNGRFLKLPVGYTFWVGEDGRIGLKVKTTFFYGKYRFTINDESGRSTADVDTLSIVPGLELIIPVKESENWEWFLKPFAELGFGWNFNIDEPTGIDLSVPVNYIYNLGIKSLFYYYWKDFRFGIGNQLSYAGNGTYDFDFHSSFALLKNGIDIKHPLGFSIKGFSPDASIFFIHYFYLPEVEIARIDREELEVDHQFQIAFTIGSAKPFKLLFFNNPRIGFGYLFGDDVKALTVNFGFPY
jgi:hypothetical protein